MPQSTHTSSSLTLESIPPRDSTTTLLPSAPRDTNDFADTTDPKARSKRRFLGLGKKKDNNTLRQPDTTEADMSAPSPSPSQPALQPAAPLSARKDLRPQPLPISPRNPLHQQALAASPSRLRSSSPRLHSPASSEIFERNVQEPVPISADQVSTAHIPAHVMTEDHIPAALEASAQAITNTSLGPDEVEIVTSSTHLPAGASVLEGPSSIANLHSTPHLRSERSQDFEVASSLQASGFIAHPGLDDDTASNYGQLDPADVRRLSFISFADVVQSEHQFPTSAPQFGEDSLHMGSISSSLNAQDRAASPFRSPRSPGSSRSRGLATPPPVTIDNAVHLDQSPARSGHLGSPGHSVHGELTIETMRQAVRKTASGDLTQMRSPAALSPVSSPDESLLRDTSRQPTRSM